MLAIVVAVIATGFRAGLRGWRSYDLRQELHRDLRTSLALLTDDLARSLPVADGGVRFAEDELTFWVQDPLGGAPALCHWQIADGQVRRLLQRPGSESPGARPLVVTADVAEAAFEFLSQGDWQDSLSADQLPEAVRMTLFLDRGGEHARAYTSLSFAAHRPPRSAEATPESAR